LSDRQIDRCTEEWAGTEHCNILIGRLADNRKRDSLRFEKQMDKPADKKSAVKFGPRGDDSF
jgi:hypothetical protein